MPRKRTSFASRVKSRRGSAAAPSPPRDTASSAHRAADSANGADRTSEPVSAPAKPQQDPDEGYVAVGRILGPFGLKGELKVQPLTDNADRFMAGSRLWAGQQPVTVAASREAQNHLYLMLKGFNERQSVEKLRHALLQVPETDLPPLPEGQYYRFQLVGLAVVSRDESLLGTLAEVIETGANDVYRVRTPDGADLLLPALNDVIVTVDLDARRMVVDPPEWR